MRSISEIIIHCADTPEGRDNTVADIAAWHKAKGYRTIGYHYVVYRDGSIHPGRPIEEIGAHCKGHNAHSIGICYIGGQSADGKAHKDTRTPEQKEALLSLLTPVIIIGGIWMGVFTPTEAACIAVVYAFFLSVILYKGMTLKEIFVNIRQAVADSAGILNIICGAAAFSWLVTMMGLTNALSHALTSLTTNKYIMLLILNIAFLLIGMFMEALSVMTITIPFLIPLLAMASLTWGVTLTKVGVPPWDVMLMVSLYTAMIHSP